MTKRKLLLLFNDISEKEKSMIYNMDRDEAEILNLSDEIDSNYDFVIPFIDRKEILKRNQNEVIDYTVAWSHRKGSEQIFKTKNIKHILTTSKGVSMWWFNALQLKDFEGNPLYNKLIFLNIIEELLSENKYDELIIFGGDKIFRRTVADIFYNPKVILSHPTHINKFLFETSIFITGILKTLGYTVLLLKRMIFIKNNYKTSNLDKSKHDVSFLGLHPCSLLNKNGTIVERYYGTLPAKLKENGLNVNFISVFCELKGNKKDFNKNYLDSLNKYDFNVILLETLLSIKDILSVLNIYITIIFRFYFLPTETKKKLFVFKEKDLYHLIGKDFFNSLYSHHFLINLLISESAYKYSTLYDPDCLVSCYTFNFVGRAVNHGIRRGNGKQTIIGIQHASMTKNKVVFRAHPDEINTSQNEIDHVNCMPFPDYYITQGYLAYDLITSNGFLKEKCFVCGSPRFDNLFVLSRKLEKHDHLEMLPELRDRIPEHSKIILVATSFTKYDSIQLIDLAFKGIDKKHFIIFKAHPNCPIKDILTRYSKDFPDIHFILSDENVNELIMVADILVTTYSTVADESIAIGKPAISVHAGVHVNMSSFESLNCNIVGTPEDLKKEIDRILSGDEKQFERKRKYIIEQCFGKLDGHATERVVNKIYQIMRW